LRDLSVSDWARMSEAVAQRECEALARVLPHGLRFDGLKTQDYCGRTHRIAHFSRTEAGDLVQFVLVSGGEVSLGFDGRAFKASSEQIESFAESSAHYDIDSSIHRFVDSQTSPRRTVCLSPLLVEVQARQVAKREDLDPLSESDPMFERFRNDCPQG